jgi:hypothetical protein
VKSPLDLIEPSSYITNLIGLFYEIKTHHWNKLVLGQCGSGEMVYTHVSEACGRKAVGVQVPLSAVYFSNHKFNL